MTKINITKMLLESNNVNNYTKILIILSQLDYYNDYYIPNKKLANRLKINENNKREIPRLLIKLKKDNIIKLNYKNNKRFFKFINNDNDYINIDNIKYIDNDIFEYNWLDSNDI